MTFNKAETDWKHIIPTPQLKIPRWLQWGALMSLFFNSMNFPLLPAKSPSFKWRFPLSCLWSDLLDSFIIIVLYTKLSQNKFCYHHSNAISVYLCIISSCFQVAPFTRAICVFPSVFQNYKTADILYWYMLWVTMTKTWEKIFEPAVLFWFLEQERIP